MRATCAHGHAQALAVTHNDVCPPFTGWRQQGERQQIRGGDQQGFLAVAVRGSVAPVIDGTGAGGVLHQSAKVRALQCGGKRGMVLRAGNAPSQGLRAGMQHFQCLWVHVGVHQKDVAASAGAAACQSHGFCCCGGFIEHGGVGNGHAGEVTHHGLKIQQGLQPALRNFRLIWRVGGVPGGVFQYVALDYAGGVRAVIALANKALEDAIAAGNGFEFLQCFIFSGRWRQVHGRMACNIGWNQCVNQRLPRWQANGAQHVRFVLRTGANVASLKGVALMQLRQGRLQSLIHHPTSLIAVRGKEPPKRRAPWT